MKNLITKEDTPDIELQLGYTEEMYKMVEVVAKREGFGTLFSKGVRKFSEKINGSRYLLVLKKNGITSFL